MKTARHILTLMIMFLITASIHVNAQGNGKGNGKNKGHEKHEVKRHPHHDHKVRHHESRTIEHHHRASKQTKHVHYHHAPVPVRHVHHHHTSHCDQHVIVRHERPRYVYYSEYDVYFDYHRNVYISYSGRNWTISASLPVAMRHVDVRRVRYTEVEYYDDDFVTYLDRGRPMYGRVVYRY